MMATEADVSGGGGCGRQILAPGELADDFNFNTDKKRILNYKYEPSFEDNVKQDISIDVYGRKEEGKGDINDEIERLVSTDNESN